MKNFFEDFMPVVVFGLGADFFFGVMFAVTEVKPRDYHDAHDDERHAEFVSDFEQIIPVATKKTAQRIERLNFF